MKSVKVGWQPGDVAAVWALQYYVPTAAGLLIVNICFIGLNAGQEITSHPLGHGRWESCYPLAIMAYLVLGIGEMHLIQS